eukprot:6310229-Lingulodinium_polyedra.AAC.1
MPRRRHVAVRVLRRPNPMVGRLARRERHPQRPPEHRLGLASDRAPTVAPGHGALPQGGLRRAPPT